MILIDERQGSAELEPLFRSKGVEVAVDHLEFADFAFEGNGPEGRCMVGVERKRLLDLINSMSTGRLTAHQIPGMLEAYQFSYLVVEGIFRADARDGLLETMRQGQWVPVVIGSRRFMYREINNFLTSIDTMSPVRLRRSGNTQETVQIVSDLYAWFNNKRWRDHHTFDAVYKAQEGRVPLEIRKPSLVRRVAAELPGVGIGKARSVEQHFGCVQSMVDASVGDWIKIDGIGAKTAERIVCAILGQEG